MLFYAQKIGDKSELCKFDDGRPVPCPFRRLANESKLKREARRIAHNIALYSAGYSAQEYKGRTDIQGQLSGKFEATHFFNKIDENSIYIVEFTPEIPSNTNAWAVIRSVVNTSKTLVNKAASFVDKYMTGNEPAFEVPTGPQYRHRQANKYAIHTFKPSDADTKSRAEASISSTPSTAARATTTAGNPTADESAVLLLHKYSPATGAGLDLVVPDPQPQGTPTRKRRTMPH